MNKSWNDADSCYEIFDSWYHRYDHINQMTDIVYIGMKY